MPKTSILCVLLCCFTFNLFAQKYIGEKKDIDQILSKVSAFSRHVMNSDYDSIALSYTADGKIFPNKSDIIEHRKEVRAWWVLPEGVRTSYHKVTPEEIKINGDDAYDYGYYEGRTRRRDGSESPFKGKYVIVWKKVNGEWKIYLDIWNSL